METAQEVFDAAIEAEESGDSETAVRLYEQSSRIEPANPLPLLRLALLLCEEDRCEEAIRVGLRVTKLRPRVPESYFVIAQSYGKLGRWAMAERHFRRLVSLQRTPETLVFLGHALINLERDDEAEEYFLEVLKLDPDNEDAHLNLGYICKERGETAVAEKYLKRTIEIAPEYAVAHAQLGELLAKQTERRKEAVDSLRSAIQHNPDDGWSRAYLANALVQLKEPEAAEEQYQKLVELWPNEGLSYWCYGDFLASEGNDDATAEWYLRKGVEVEPDSEFTNYYLGKHLFHWDRDEEAKRFLARAARLGHAKAREMLQYLEDCSSETDFP
jgi:tetratricopeptide (TPR) repeat protein